jgi:xylan 1,4-beta-xylosidase
VSVIDSDNCHLQWEKSLFSGNRSQLTPLVSYPSTDLLKKPMFNGYVLLSRLGSERLAVASGARDFGTKWGALATRSAGSVSVLLYNFEDGMAEDVNERTLHVRVDALPWAGPSRLLHYRIDTHHSNAYTIWKSLGRPNPPTHEQIRQLREREGLELAEPVQELELEGTWEQSVTLPMHAVSLLVLVPENLQPPAAPALVTAELERGLHGTLQVFLKWTPDASTDFLHYRLVRRDANGDSVLCESSSFNTATYVDMDVEADASYEYRVQSVNASGRAGGFSESILPNTDAAR